MSISMNFAGFQEYMGKLLTMVTPSLSDLL